MYERQSRFLTQPGDIKVLSSSLRLTKGGAPLTRWRVRLAIDGLTYFSEYEVLVLAYSSTDATERAKADFYGRWATPADRECIPLRVIEILQVDV